MTHYADEKMLRRWGVPTAEAEFVCSERLRDTDALTFAKEFVQHRTTSQALPIMVLAGGLGVGKTVAAAYVMRHANPLPMTLNFSTPVPTMFKPGVTPRFRHVSEIVEIGMWDKEFKADRAELRTTQCLVVDDLGAEHHTPRTKALLDALVNHRYGLAGSTVITTNLTAEQFAQRYGARVIDRIRGRGAWYDINHASLRGRS